MSRAIRADALRQAMGLFNLLLGALFIVAPHRLDGSMYAGIGQYASGVGVGLIVGGMALIGSEPRPAPAGGTAGPASAWRSASAWPS